MGYDLGQLILGEDTASKGPNLDLLHPVLYGQIQSANKAYREQYGTDLPITSGARTREEQQLLVDRAAKGEPNIFMPTNPAKEPNRQSYHENAIDISTNIPPEFAARMEKEFGLHRPYGAKDPVHWEVHPEFKPVIKAQTDAYAPADQAISTAQNSQPSLGDLILGGTELNEPKAVAPQAAAPSTEQPTVAPTAPVSESGIEQLPVKNLTPAQQAKGEESVAKIAGNVDAVLAMPAGIAKSLATAYMYLGERAMPGAFPLEKREEIANAIGSALTPELAKTLGVDPNNKGYQEALLQKVGQLFEKGIDYTAEKTGLPKSDLEAFVNLVPFTLPKIKIKSAVESIKEQFAAKEGAPRFEPRLEPTAEQLTPQEPAAAGNLQQQFAQKKIEQMPVTAAANEPIVPAEQITTPTAAAQLEGQFQGLKGAGAAEVEQPVLRQARANQLDVPIQLSKDQATRDPADVRFARETAKDPVLGAKLQEKYAEDNAKLQQNLDIAIEKTGAEYTGVNPGDLADMVVKVVEPERKRRYGEVSNAYTIARDAGEMSAPIEIDPLKKYLDKNSSAATNAPVLTSVAAELKKLSEGKETLSINDLEEVRKMVNNISEPGTPNGHYGKEINRLIDKLTEKEGGELYRKARKLNAEFMTEFEDTPIIRNLTAMKKGTTQRVIAMENLIDKSLLKGSLDDVKQLFGSFERMGPAGESIAKELRGFVAEKIKADATSGVNRDINGRPYLSTHHLNKIITDLDKSGKLDFIFGSEQADKFRTINEVTKDLQTVPVGTTNPSGTASTLLATMAEMGAQTAMTGVPVPIAMVAKHLYGKRQTAKKLNKIQEFLDYGKNLGGK
jgi:hypothetical protein